MKHSCSIQRCLDDLAAENHDDDDDGDVFPHRVKVTNTKLVFFSRGSP